MPMLVSGAVSSVGRAPHLQCGGQRFESATVHSMDNKSPHILNASSNLLGFTFLVLSSIKGFGLPQAGAIDEVVVFLVVSFAMSCFFSFLSMRSKSERSMAMYEQIADYIFFFGLSILLITSVLLVFDLITFAR